MAGCRGDDNQLSQRPTGSITSPKEVNGAPPSGVTTVWVTGESFLFEDLGEVASSGTYFIIGDMLKEWYMDCTCIALHSTSKRFV